MIFFEHWEFNTKPLFLTTTTELVELLMNYSEYIFLRMKCVIYFHESGLSAVVIGFCTFEDQIKIKSLHYYHSILFTGFWLTCSFD